MIDSGSDTLEDKIATAFHLRALELESDISTAAWVIDPQFVVKSRKASSELMKSFWVVSRAVLRNMDDVDWKAKRGQLVSELVSFRMKTGGFGMEDYSMTNSCSFWSVAGCHAPNLQELAMRLAPLPCSSGEAERNWFEVKQNLTKKRNRLGKESLAKMVFVRRFIRLKRKVCANESCSGFSDWVSELLSQAAGESSDSSSGASISSVDSGSVSAKVFTDRIEDGEQRRVNGKEPGQPVVGLTQLKKDNAAKSWLFNKYYNMCFVDKNPEEDADAPPLADESEWEHRVIKQIVWWRRRGFAVETCLHGNVTDQSIVRYRINEALHSMIRASTHNTCTMMSQRDREAFESSGEDDVSGEGDASDDSDSDTSTSNSC